jgi:hypothetical protein
VFAIVLLPAVAADTAATIVRHSARTTSDGFFIRSPFSWSDGVVVRHYPLRVGDNLEADDCGLHQPAGLCNPEAMLRALAAVAVASTAVAFPFGAQAVGPDPVLRVVDRAPLTVTGRSFRPGATVRITVRLALRTAVRSGRSDATGRLTVVFPGVRLTGRWRCGAGVTITARAPGELVLWHGGGLPDCPSPSRPPA